MRNDEVVEILRNQSGGATVHGSSRFPQRVLWGSLTVTLLIVIIALIALILTGKFRLQPDTQDVRIIAPDHPAALINQSAVVDKHNSVVIYSVTSHTNHTSTVLYDIKHSLLGGKSTLPLTGMRLVLATLLSALNKLFLWWVMICTE
ncbi:hypothetical protein QTP70_000314 [Hemibagrus guttatus]|uniref:Uncharacterized protein n=1 Tax=Hemibagrus guttatus TaxID=175788 RepID=A0AAE0QMY3_9TELE|nr:hypothetical protein QTP70_000314 [Hemibagrus guttatus]